MMNMNDGHSSLQQGLKELHLPTIRDCFLGEADLARQESLTYEQYLLELVERECETRKHSRIARLLRESKLPLEKNMESFDRKRLPAKLNAHIDALLEGSFMDRAENVLAFGNPGSGKTHLLCAISAPRCFMWVA